MMNKTLSCLMLVQLVFPFCAYAAPKKETPLPELSAVKLYAQASMQLGRRWTTQTQEPDWDKMNQLYDETIRPVIKEIDALYGLRYEEELREALDKCIAGEKVTIYEQLLNKGLMHVTVQAIRRELDFMATANQADMKDSAERIAVYFGHIRPVFVRRDRGYFEGEKVLEKAADDALERLRRAEKSDFPGASRSLEDAISRTIALSVLYEIEELEKYRDSDIDFCDVKQIEAVVYYRYIQTRIERRSRRINEMILNMLNGSYGAMNSRDLENYLARGLSLQLR